VTGVLVIVGVIVIIAGCFGLFMGLERASLRRLERRREAWRAAGCVGPEPERSTLKVQPRRARSRKVWAAGTAGAVGTYYYGGGGDGGDGGDAGGGGEGGGCGGGGCGGGCGGGGD
jgi:hypothetical protein